MICDRVGATRDPLKQQSVTKHLRLTLFFMKNSTPREKIKIAIFRDFFARTSKILFGRAAGH